MEKIRTLIISGVLSNEHNYVEMDQYLRTMLESTGRFTVKVTEEFNGATERTLRDYDLIVLNYDGRPTLKSDYIRWDEKAEQVFKDFVKAGKGLMLHHSVTSLDDSIKDDFGEIWGLYMWPPYGRKCPMDDFIVHVEAPDDPIMKGLDDFMVTGDDFMPGICQYPGTNPVTLASVFDDIEVYRKAPNFPPSHYYVEVPEGKLENMLGVNTYQPVAWKNTYGEGRVFACSIGHDIDTYRRVNYLTMFVRGCEWAATGEVTLDKPDRSGERRFRKWPYYGD